MQDSAGDLGAASALLLGQQQKDQTKLGSSDKSPDEDISPKPTVFLPSVAEVEVHKAGTYLCLLEDFFPDVIKVDWKERDDKTILKSQQGDTMKTKGTYMKFSWLTVTGASMDKEHKCIVNHQINSREVVQELLFPSIKKVLMAVTESAMDSQGHSETKQKTDLVTVSPLNSRSFSPDPMAVGIGLVTTRLETSKVQNISHRLTCQVHKSGTTAYFLEAPCLLPLQLDVIPLPVELAAINATKSLNDENETLQLQLMNTSAYYTYLLLLLTSLIYSVIIVICLLGSPALSDNGKSS